MKYQFIICLICFSMMEKVSFAQQEKPASPKKPTTTSPKTIKKATVISKPPIITTPLPSPPTKIEEKKPSKTTTPNSSTHKVEIPDEQPSSTTVQQSSGPMKGNKLDEDVKIQKPIKVKKTKIPLEGRDIRFGVRAEITQHYTLEVGGGTDFSPGVNIGVLANLPIGKQISIQPEVLFSLINIKASTDEDNYVKSSMGSILVPLMFNFNFGKSTTKFMLNLGGYGIYGLSQNTKVISVGTTIKDSSVDLGNDRFDFGLGIGLGIKLNDKLMVEARSFYGMKDNINKNGFGTIGVGYFF